MMDAGAPVRTVTTVKHDDSTQTTQHAAALLVPDSFPERLQKALEQRSAGATVQLQLLTLGCNLDEIGLWWASRDADTYLSIIADAEAACQRSALGFSKTVRWRATCMRYPSHTQLLPLRDAAILELDKVQHQLLEDLEPYELYASCAIHAAKLTTSYRDLTDISRWARQVSDGDGGRRPGHTMAERLERDLIESGWVWGAWGRHKPLNTWSDAVGHSLATHSTQAGNAWAHSGYMPTLALNGLSNMGYTVALAKDQADARLLAEALLGPA
jgi:hypothetical protein